MFGVQYGNLSHTAARNFPNWGFFFGVRIGGRAEAGGSGLYALARFWFSVIISRMKNVLFRRGVSAVCAGILCASPAPAWGKSAKEVFAEVARSVVVVLALDSSGETSAQGSGVVVGKNEVATNCHVIEDAAKIVVRQAADSSGGENYRMSAEILARDNEQDLCLLLVDELSEPPAAPVATMGEAKGLTVGEEIFAVGAPEGLELSMSRGIVSQLRGFHGKRAAPLVQTDAAISPGSSGGGLFNENGELVGITTFKWKGESLNFAIPAEWVGELWEKTWKELAAKQECPANPNYKCVMAIALSVARKIGDAQSRGWALRDVAVAQAGAGDTSGAFVTARSINLMGIQADAVRKIILAQAEAGDIDGALFIALSIDSMGDRVKILRNIALMQENSGDRQSAQETLSTALSVARRVPFFRDVVLREIATAQVEIGDVDGAFTTARNADDADDRDQIMRDIAIAQAEAGDIDGAFATARRVVNVKYSADAFRNIISIYALAQAEAGNKQSAQDGFAIAISVAFNRYDNAYSRADALREIGLVQAEAGEKLSAWNTFTVAVSIAQSIDDSNSSFLGPAWTLRLIASAQAESGDINGAFATARSIDIPQRRALAFIDIAQAQTKLGDIDDAFATARSIPSSRFRARALHGIASIQVEYGDIDSAFAIAQGIDVIRYRAKAFRDIVLWQADAEEFSNAMKLAMKIEEENNRVNALAAIAKHLAVRERN